MVFPELLGGVFPGDAGEDFLSAWERGRVSYCFVCAGLCDFCLCEVCWRSVKGRGREEGKGGGEIPGCSSWNVVRS